MRKIALFSQRYFLLLHIALALVASVLWGILVFVFPIGDMVYHHIADGLPSLYRASITVAGSLMGFSMTVTVLAKDLWSKDVFVFTAAEPRFERQIWAAMRQSTWSLGAVVLIAIVGVLLSGDADMVKFTSVPYTGITVLASIKLSRAIRLVHKMLDVVLRAKDRD